VNREGKIELVIPAGSMTDSSIDPRSGESAFSSDVAFDLAEEKGGLVLTVTPGLEWLQAPERVYPVEVDPSVTLYATLDTFVQTGITSGQSGSDELKAGTFDGGSTKARSFIRFNISSISGKQILSADFSLYEFHSWSCSAREVRASRVTESWGAGVVWSNQPDTANAFDTFNVAKGFSSSCPAGRITFDASAPVDKWADGSQPNYGFRVRAGDETDNYGWKKFRSEDYGGTSTDPRLIVNYNSYPTAPTSLVPAAGTINTSATRTTPTLAAKYNDPDSGDTGHVDYQMCSNSSCSSVVASGSGPNVDPGTASPWTVPAEKLASGTEYWWRARSDDGRVVSAWTTTRSYIPNQTPALPTNMQPVTQVLTSRTPALTATYQDADPGDTGEVYFELLDSSDQVVASGAGNAAQPGQASTWVVSTTLPDGTYHWRAVSRDGIQESPSAAHGDATIDLRGDVYHAQEYSGDPATGGELIGEEWAQLNTLSARREDAEEVTARTVIPCVGAIPAGSSCDRVTGHTLLSNGGTAVPEACWQYTSAFVGDDQLEQVARILAPATTDIRPVVQTGSLTTALEAWQIPPPGAGANFAMSELIDLANWNVTRRWIGQRTKMPLKELTFSPTEDVLASVYWTYPSGFQSINELPADFFTVSQPANLGFEEIVDVYGTEIPGTVTDTETSTTFSGFYLGRSALVDTASGPRTACLSEVAVVKQRLVPAQRELWADEDPETLPDELGPDTYVMADYEFAPTPQGCPDRLGKVETPDLDIMSFAEESSLASAYRGTYMDTAQQIEASPSNPEYDRTGVRSVVFRSMAAMAFVLPDGMDSTTSLVITNSPTATSIIIDGDLDKLTIDDVVARLVVIP
jgi:hypothetical protein